MVIHTCGVFANLNVLDVINEAKADDTLVQAMGEEFHAAIQDRLQSDPDYDPAKYPSAQKFYQPKQ